MTQTKAEAPRIHLARPDEPGASFYNSYHYLTQISALYAQAGQYESKQTLRPIWLELCDATLVDLGDVFLVWEATLKAGRSGKPGAADEQTYTVIARACRRAVVILDHVNVWTPVDRWIRLLSLCERRWQRILTRLGDAHPLVKPKLEVAAQASLDRHSRLKGLAETARTEAARIDDSFVPDGGGPFGGSVGF